MVGEEIDKLNNIEEQEKLTEDCAYIKRIMINMKNTSMLWLETLRLDYISENMELNIDEIMAINKFVEYIKKKS